jgi:hypothetical protein
VTTALKRTAHWSKACRVLLAGLAILTVTSGCASSAKKLSTASTVVTTWRGDLVGEQRLNETAEFDRPAVGGIERDIDEEVLRVELVQRRTSRFDLQKTFQMLEARASQWVESGSKLKSGMYDYGWFTGFLVTYATFGVYPVVETGTMSVRDAQLRAEETRAIDRLKAGEDEVIVRQARRYLGGWVYASNITRRYWRDVAGEETELVPSQTDIQLIAASGIPARLESAIEPELAANAITDEAGVAEFPLTDSLNCALDLDSGDLRLLAEWQGEWIDLGPVALK